MCQSVADEVGPKIISRRTTWPLDILLSIMNVYLSMYVQPYRAYTQAFVDKTDKYEKIQFFENYLTF
jgi:hypothetical protein